MAIPTTIINARVKQKIATDAYWLSIESELGVILAGEMALVYNDDGLAVNFKVGDGTKTYSELPFFITYFNNVTNCKVLSYIDQSANLTIPLVFRNKSELAKMVFINQSGTTQTIKIGTTDGGSEIGEIEVPNDIVNIGFDYDFTESVTLYVTGLTGVNYSMFILYYQLDEAPVVPSGGGGGGITKRYVPGDVYQFIPLYAGHEEIEFDLITGFGRVGTDHEGAVLFGTNDLPDLSRLFLRGYRSGDTLGGEVGQDSVTLVQNNIPRFTINLPNSSTPGRSDNANDRDVMIPTSQQSLSFGQTSPTPVATIPKAKIVLFFTGITTT